MYHTKLEKYLEKNAGLIISSCLFSIFFVLMLVNSFPVKITSDAKPLSVDINLIPPAILTPASETKPEDKSMFEPVRKTSPGNFTKENISEPANAENKQNTADSAAEIAKIAADNGEVSVITSEDIIAQADNIEKSKQELEGEKQDIKKWLEKKNMMLHGRDTLGPSDGKSKGITRSLNLEGFPKSVLDQVMAKYSIKIKIKYVKADAQYSYLNQASLGGDNVFYNQKGEGVFEVFEMSTLAIHRMSALELMEIQKRNLVSSKTRVTLVEFGIIKNEQNEYDLGITKFEYDQIK